jgi:chromosome segregation ATPase
MISETEGAATTEWSEAVAASDHLNIEAVLADLEARYATLEKERDHLHERSQVESERVISLENKAVALQNALSKAESVLAEVSRDSQIEKDKFLTVEAKQKMQQERITRLEEEGDNLREEIR